MPFVPYRHWQSMPHDTPNDLCRRPRVGPHVCVTCMLACRPEVLCCGRTVCVLTCVQSTIAQAEMHPDVPAAACGCRELHDRMLAQSVLAITSTAFTYMHAIACHGRGITSNEMRCVCCWQRTTYSNTQTPVTPAHLSRQKHNPACLPCPCPARKSTVYTNGTRGQGMHMRAHVCATVTCCM